MSRRFPFLSQIRHRFRVAIVLFHDGIVAAAAAPPAMSHRLTMLRPRFHFHRSQKATHPGFSVPDFAEAKRFSTIPASAIVPKLSNSLARRPRFVDGRGRLSGMTDRLETSCR